MLHKRTYKDRAEYMKMAVDKRRKKIKEMAIKYAGGKCCICGYKRYNGALEFHHIDEKQKKFGISMGGLTRSWEKTRMEVDKCILLCSNCHKEIHAGHVQLSQVIENVKRGELLEA